MTQINHLLPSPAADDSFTVFCTGNHDSTGSCLEVSKTEEHKELNCIMVPGNIIDCKNDAKERIECILMAATSAQAEFSCSKNTERTFELEETNTIEIPTTQTINEIEYENKEDLDTSQTNDENKGSTDINQTSIFNSPFEKQ